MEKLEDEGFRKEIGEVTHFSNWLKIALFSDINKNALDQFFKVLKHAPPTGGARTAMVNLLRMLLKYDNNMRLILENHWERLNETVFTYFNKFNL